LQHKTISMKKVFLMLAAVGLSVSGIAQDRLVTSAAVAMQGKNIDEAKDDIDKAMGNPETKEKPKALLLKAQIYMAMVNEPKYKDSHPYREATTALFRLVEVKPEYEKSTVDQLLGIAAFLYYNDGARAYNDKKLDDATEFMKTALKIRDMKRFDKFTDEQKRKIDTVSADAQQTLANSAYYRGKYDEAIPQLTTVKNNPITRSPSVYECLIDALDRQNKKDEELTVIQEGRKAFPDDLTIRNYELNFYIKSGKDDEVIRKLEEAAAKEPNNAEIQFNLATTYEGMANGKDGKKPANTAELTTKAEDAFQKALKMDPDNAVFNYNFGALYFNQATEVNNQMNSITGSSDADQKKYDNLKAQRDAIFAKATPYFEKANTSFAAREKDLRAEDKNTYKTSLKALMDIYSRLSKMDKYGETKKKYESLN